jgi:hypothetical protein
MRKHVDGVSFLAIEVQLSFYILFSHNREATPVKMTVWHCSSQWRVNEILHTSTTVEGFYSLWATFSKIALICRLKRRQNFDETQSTIGLISVIGVPLCVNCILLNLFFMFSFLMGPSAFVVYLSKWSYAHERKTSWIKDIDINKTHIILYTMLVYNSAISRKPLVLQQYILWVRHQRRFQLPVILPSIWYPAGFTAHCWALWGEGGEVIILILGKRGWKWTYTLFTAKPFVAFCLI